MNSSPSAHTHQPLRAPGFNVLTDPELFGHDALKGIVVATASWEDWDECVRLQDLAEARAKAARGH